MAKVIEPTQALDVEDLKSISRELRVDIIEMITEAGSGHPGGSLSAIDALVCLYFGGVLRYNPTSPAGRSATGSSSRRATARRPCTRSLARAGFFPHDWLKTFRKFGSPLQGHPDRTPAARRRGVHRLPRPGTVGRRRDGDRREARQVRAGACACMLGDGESQAGQVWEAAMSAPKSELDNLCAIVDHNQVQQTDRVAEIMDLAPLAEKFRAFSWHAIEIDGHDHAAVLDALREAMATHRCARPRSCRGR